MFVLNTHGCCITCIYAACMAAAKVDASSLILLQDYHNASWLHRGEFYTALILCSKITLKMFMNDTCDTCNL